MRIDQLRTEKSILTWSNLRPLLNGIGTKASIAFPAVGYLLLLNDRIAESLDLNLVTGGKGTLLLTSTTRLQLLYFGLILISVAATWFRLRAPKSVIIAEDSDAYRSVAFANFSVLDFVKIYHSLERKYQFGLFGDTPYTKDNLCTFIERACPRLPQAASDYEDDEIWFLMGEVEEPHAAILKSREFLGSVLDAKYEYDQFEQQNEAKMLSALTGFALVLLAVPSIDVFISIVADLVGFTG